MAKDFARNTRPSASRKKRYEPRVPAWVWLFTGGVLGAFIMFLMRLSEIEDPQDKPQQSTKVEQQEIKTSEKAPPEEPRFNFYELLKETTVNVPELTEEERTASARTSEIEYILQVASFQNIKDAEQLRAELVLLNMNATVENATIRNGETWYRVLVGPFVSRSNLAKARSTLASNKLNALVLKRPLSNKP